MFHVVHQFLILQDIILSVSQYFYIYCLLQFLSCPFVSHAYMCECIYVILFFNGLTSNNFNFYLSFDFIVKYLTEFCYSFHQSLFTVFLFFLLHIFLCSNAHFLILFSLGE